MVANPAREQLKAENDFFSCPHSRLRIWSRETGLAVPYLDSSFILSTQSESGAYSRDPSIFPRRHLFLRLPPSGQSRVHWVTHVRTDDSPPRLYRPSIISPQRGFDMDQYAPLFPHTHCGFIGYSMCDYGFASTTVVVDTRGSSTEQNGLAMIHYVRDVHVRLHQAMLPFV